MKRLPIWTRVVAVAFALLVLTAQSCHPHTDRWDLVCIRAHESDTAGGYLAQNPRSTASGAYQYLDSTWRAVTRQVGMGTEYRRAVHAPPHVQDAVTLAVLDRGGQSHWRGTGCFR